MAAPDPDPSTVKDYVLPEPYQPQKYKEGVQNEEGEKETLVTAINKTLKAEFRHNPDTFIWGQDVANKEKGGVFNITKGMQQEFGIERVFNAPIAEDYIVGTANGMCRFDPKIHVVIEARNSPITSGRPSSNTWNVRMSIGAATGNLPQTSLCA